MPKSPDWLTKLDTILPQVQALGDSRIVRLDVERLCAVKRTEASRILQNAGATLIGRDLTLRADELFAYLKSRGARPVKKHRARATAEQRAEQEFEFAAIAEAERRSEFASRLMQIIKQRPVQNVVVDMGRDYTGEEQTFSALPREIVLTQPILQITFTDWHDLVRKLTMLGFAMQYDFPRFVELTGEPVEQASKAGKDPVEISEVGLKPVFEICTQDEMEEVSS
jgi:hypothetical protein